MRATGIETYADLAKTCGGMVLANEMASRPLEGYRTKSVSNFGR